MKNARVGGGGGVGGAVARRGRRVAIVKPLVGARAVADATRDLFVRPHGLRRNVRGAGLACAAAAPSALE